MVKRLAIAAGVVFLLGAVFVAVVPSSPSGAKCGSLVNPNYTDGETRTILKKAERLYNEAEGLDLGGEDYQGSALSIAQDARAANIACEDARSSRRTWLFALIGLAIVIPVTIAFVGGARKRSDQGDPA
jgi:hypothetical protein